MPYLYTINLHFEDYASGRVFYAQTGQPAFPVRLASEIFQRTLKHWRAAGGKGCHHIYDPVCGGAYWLAYLHWDEIATISASDVAAEVLSLAECNLSLLTLAGLDQRVAEIEKMLSEFSKESHAAALESAHWLRQQLKHNLKTHAIEAQVFQADAIDPESIGRGLGQRQADLILADVPYGWHSIWISNGEPMLEALHPTLSPGSVVAIAADKSQKIQSENFLRLARFQIGKHIFSF